MTAVVLLVAMLQQPIATAPQSALRTGGPIADRIGWLWDVMLWSGTIITLLVFAYFAYALFRRRPADFVPEADREADARGERFNDESGGRGREERGRPRSERIGARVMIGAGLVLPTIVLAVVLVLTLRVLAAIALPSRTVEASAAPPPPDELTVQVTGMQYWWRVTYLDAQPQRQFETANELRIPVGRRVVVRLRSGDVIHSFWVPGLAGKMDLVPGRINALALEASAPGTWRGQCAEFCGVQHAMMAFVVVAMPPDEWERWAAAQRLPAAPPDSADSLAVADQAAFLGSGCVLCHAVRGTTARAAVGPDLTHVASRATLAAGLVPNTTGHRYGWIADPQALKPGSKMPAVPLTSEELHAIVRHLGTLR
jgi:cytochrome c oxidase subunit 2